MMVVKERTQRAEGVVLRHSDFGEADRLLVLFTREMGKVRAIAKGVRKPRSRKGGHLEPFTRVNLLLAKGRHLSIITQAEALNIYYPLYEDLELFGHVSYIIELIDRFTLEGEANPALYALLIETLERLNDGENPFLVVRYYELRMLDFVGFRPELFECVSCKAKIEPEDQFFSYEMGGVLCPQCAPQHDSMRPVSLNALRFLRHYQRSSYTQARRAKVNDLIRMEMETLMQAYVAYLLERSLNSPAFLRRLRREDAKPER